MVLMITGPLNTVDRVHMHQKQFQVHNKQKNRDNYNLYIAREVLINKLDYHFKQTAI